VRAVAEKEKIKRAVLVGNSLGGPVALEAARLLGSKALGVIAVDTFQVFDQHAPAGYFKKIGESFRSNFTETMKQIVRSLFHTDADSALYAKVEKRMLDNSPEMAASVMSSFDDYNLADLAKQMKLPIRCINGDLFSTQIENNREIHPDFDAVIIPHTGHYPMLEKPELFNRHLMEILEEMTKIKDTVTATYRK
jgi:pimeloyl-ACP methyl ester carboxylesterase